MSNTDNTPDAADLPSIFNPADVEGPMYQRWVDAGYFTANPNSGKSPYTIVIPPPNVTGSLHLGHAFEHTLIDILVRRRRMQGFDALWLPGMDHAGIATQNVVEKQLRTKGASRHELGREQFVQTVWDWKDESGGMILNQMRRLGDSVDWTRERFTMDAGLSRAVHTIFKRMFDDDLIYRAERIINWCPDCLTAVSDIEVEHTEDVGELVELRYPLVPLAAAAGSAEPQYITVATTRVETMLGDTAVVVHPDDDRYGDLIGREVELPLTGRRISIVADAHVDPEFGTGAVKVTPAHDPNDFAIAGRHNLPSITVLDEHAVVTGTGTAFDGMDRFTARAAIRAALGEQGLVGKVVAPYVHSVGHCQRSGTVIEPRLSLQWFVRVASLAKASGDAVRTGAVQIHPAEMDARWFAWVDTMYDWCISRQLWWGHRIPVWYGPNGETVCVGPDEQPPTGEGWTQDEDVLDTWFSSGLWPFSTLGWPEKTTDLQTYYPNSVLVTGYDILFFWVARMMMFSLYAMDGAAPYPSVVLHGMVRDEHGKKMSKSFGNVVNPIDWMDRYGSDALRYSLARGANPGTDLPLGESAVAAGRSFATKVWNATRFALLNGATTQGDLPDDALLAAADRWILARLQQVVTKVDAGYEDYQFAKTTQALYHFMWDEVCDWYLEMCKPAFAAGGAAAQTSARVLGEVLEVVLRLLHPTMPFVTEAAWQALTQGSRGPSVVVAAWPGISATAEPVGPGRAELRVPPVAVPTAAQQQALAQVAAIQTLVTDIRKFRSDQGIRPGRRLPAQLQGLAAVGLTELEDLVRSLAALDASDAGFTASGAVDSGPVVVQLDTSGAIDVAAERARLTKELQVAQSEIVAAEKKLANEQFVAKAPEAVVAGIRGRHTRALADVERLQAALTKLG